MLRLKGTNIEGKRKDSESDEPDASVAEALLLEILDQLHRAIE